MKYIFILLSLFPFLTFAQQFETIIPSSTESTAFNVIETAQENYLLFCSETEILPNLLGRDAFIQKLDNAGNPLETLHFEFANNAKTSVLLNAVQEHPIAGAYTFYGTLNTEDESDKQFFIKTIDEDLNILFDTILGAPLHREVIYDDVLLSDSLMLFYGYFEENQAAQYPIAYYWNFYTNEFQKKEFPNLANEFIAGSILKKQDGYVLHNDGLDGFYHLTDSFAIETAFPDEHPPLFIATGTLIPYTDSTYIQQGIHAYIVDSMTFEGAFGLSFAIFNYEGYLESSHFFNHPQQTLTPFGDNISVAPPYIYQSGVADLSGPYPFNTGGEFLVVYKYDLENNTEVWSRIIEKEAAETLVLMETKATSDGGVILVGELNNQEDGDRNVFAIKFDSDGTIVSNSEAVKMERIQVFPNPANQSVFFENCPKLTANFKCYNELGQLILNAPIEDNNVDVSALPTGFYYYQIESENEVVYAGKLQIIR